ncbi:MAG: hypothetical protein U0793_03905 [Gemmataceae bacterium]
MANTVVWDPSAQNKLTILWITAPDRQAVTDAANRIDQLLKFYPDMVGQEYGDDRLLVVEPLAVLYSYSPDDRLAVVKEVELI